MNKKIKQILENLKITLQDALEQGAKKRNFNKMNTWDKMESIAAELRGQKIANSFYLVDLFEDAIIIKTYPGYLDENQESKLLKIPYIIDNDVITFGSPFEVERVTIYEPISDVEDGHTKKQSQSGNKEGTHKEGSSFYEAIQGVEPYQIPLTDTGLLLQFDQPTIEQAKSSKKPTGMTFNDAVVTRFEIINANGIYYPQTVWEKNLPQLQEKAKNKNLVGEADHPSGAPSITRRCILFNAISMKGKELHASGEILPTSVGQDVIIQAQAGIPIAISSRGYGTTKLQEVDGKKVLVVQDDYVCETFDLVWKPAAFGSYITDFGVNQGVKTTTIPLTQSNKGEKIPMDPIQQEIEFLKSLIASMKQAGHETKNIEDQLAGIEQAFGSNVSDDVVMNMLRPFGEQVKALAIAKPSDPDKNVGVFHPARTQAAGNLDPQSQQTQKQATQSLQVVLPPELQGLAESVGEVQGLLRDQAVNQLLQGTDPTLAAMYKKQLEPFKTAKDVKDNFQSIHDSIQEIFKLSGIHIPAGISRLNKEKQFDQAPKTPQEAIHRLLEGIPNVVNETTGRRVEGPENQNYCLEKWLSNIAANEPKAMREYLLYEQGRLDQAGETTTSDVVAGSFAVFPLIRATWPLLIAHEVCSIQPMDSDTGKVFFLNTLTESGDNLNNYHYYNYADNVAELSGTAKKLKMSISSQDITAYSKKLQTQLTYEVIQDLRKKFGIDAQLELLQATAAELAREWNNQILYDMYAASGTSGNVNWGKTAPSGYTQKEWNQEQLPLHLQQLSNNIYVNRNGDMTHILASPTACLQLGKMGQSFGFLHAQGGEAKEVYAGVNLYGTINGIWKVWKVQLYETLWDKLITVGLRKGPHWSDTPYVFAPYATALTPEVHNAGQFYVNQGILDRAGKLVTVPKALGTLTIQATTGTAI